LPKIDGLRENHGKLKVSANLSQGRSQVLILGVQLAERSEAGLQQPTLQHDLRAAA
jgi:hypothetical protein